MTDFDHYYYGFSYLIMDKYYLHNFLEFCVDLFNWFYILLEIVIDFLTVASLLFPFFDFIVHTNEYLLEHLKT